MFDIEDSPNDPFAVTALDRNSIEALSLGDKYTTESKFYTILRKKDGYVVTYQKSQTVLPNLFSVFGYMSH